MTCIHRQLDRFEEAHVQLDFSLLLEVFGDSVQFVDLFHDEVHDFSRDAFVQQWSANYDHALVVHRYLLVGRGIDVGGTQALADAAVSWEITCSGVGTQTGGFGVIFGFALSGNDCRAQGILVG